MDCRHIVFLNNFGRLLKPNMATSISQPLNMQSAEARTGMHFGLEPGGQTP
jgi:hypothetical protein